MMACHVMIRLIFQVKKLKVRARVLAEKVVLTKTRLVVPVPQGEVEVPVVSTSHLAPGQQEVDPAVESQCPKENEVINGTSATAFD